MDTTRRLVDWGMKQINPLRDRILRARQANCQHEYTMSAVEILHKLYPDQYHHSILRDYAKKCVKCGKRCYPALPEGRGDTVRFRRTLPFSSNGQPGGY